MASILDRYMQKHGRDLNEVALIELKKCDPGAVVRILSRLADSQVLAPFAYVVKAARGALTGDDGCSPEYDFRLARKRLVDEKVIDERRAASLKDDARGRKAFVDWLRKPTENVTWAAGKRTSAPHHGKIPAWNQAEGPQPTQLSLPNASQTQPSPKKIRAWKDRLTRPSLSSKPSASPSSKCAYVCVLWSPQDEAALLGCVVDAFVLGFSLKRLGSGRHDRVLLATEDVLCKPFAAALRLFWKVRRVEHVPVGKHLTQGADARFNKVFTKLRAWQLEEYHRVVLLDADLLVKVNIDELFQLEPPQAIAC